MELSNVAGQTPHCPIGMTNTMLVFTPPVPHVYCGTNIAATSHTDKPYMVHNIWFGTLQVFIYLMNLTIIAGLDTVDYL